MARIPNYTGICKQGHFNERYQGGVALYMHSSCPYQQPNINSEHRVVAVRVHPSQMKTITVASIYVSGSTAITKESLGNVFSQLPHLYLLLGNFNAHSEMWENARSFRRGRTVESVMEDEFICLNDGRATHESGTAIDLSICTPGIAVDLQWNRWPSVPSSDYYPIIITLAKNVVPTMIEKRYNCKKGNWDEYYIDEAIDNLIEEEEFANPEDMLQDIQERILAAAERNIPSYVPENFYPKPF